MTRILVVEDDRIQRKIALDLLGKNGFTAEGFETGEDLLERLKTTPPADLVILDLHLPGKDGFAICRAMKASPAHRGIPVIMMTASSREEDIAEAFSAGATDYVSKPIRPLELVARLRSHLRKKAFRKRRSFYELLRCERTATAKELKVAFLQRVRACHPDHLQHLDEDIQEFALEKMKLVNEAYDVLKDEEKRAIYDRCLDEGGSFVEALTAHYEAKEQAAAAEREAASRPDPLVVRYMVEASVKILSSAIVEAFPGCRWQDMDSDFFDRVLVGSEGREKYIVHLKAYTHLRSTDLATLIRAVPDFCVNPGRTTFERDHYHVLLTAAEMEDQAKLYGAVSAFNGANQKKGPREDPVSFAIVDLEAELMHFPYGSCTKPAIGGLRLKFK